MDKKDMTLLIEAEDAINDMDRLLVQLTSIEDSEVVSSGRAFQMRDAEAFCGAGETD